MSAPGTQRPPERPRPAEFCRQLLAALEASEGRQRRRKRDTTPDSIGTAIKRDLLERAIEDDPAWEAFEHWLYTRSLAAGAASGAVRAMALNILEEWRLAAASPALSLWLEGGAASDDADP